ncbi:hypothetical protein Pen02_37450 [Plantactinospora endophytica]|uniref:Uncharacterized protein n=1 Tax=Plantactinospora endophytica TaxID=673535 RepID=A0ABQ4E285_9ACTN|nr:hypothetical protein Pen02_37450 [Plantactinospora endophytica]
MLAIWTATHNRRPLGDKEIDWQYDTQNLDRLTRMWMQRRRAR